MNAFELAQHVAQRLDEDSLPYAIGGALALTAWAIPRDTKDVDLSIFIEDELLPRAIDALERAGVMVDRADAARSITRIGMFTGRCGRTLVDVFISQHPHALEMARRRVQIASPSGIALWFITVEDLCVLKLLYGRTKDVADLERLFAAHPDMDRAHIHTWIGKMVPPGDPRLATLHELEQRFTGS